MCNHISLFIFGDQCGFFNSSIFQHLLDHLLNILIGEGSWSDLDLFEGASSLFKRGSETRSSFALFLKLVQKIIVFSENFEDSRSNILHWHYLSPFCFSSKSYLFLSFFNDLCWIFFILNFFLNFLLTHNLSYLVFSDYCNTPSTRVIHTFFYKLFVERITGNYWGCWEYPRNWGVFLEKFFLCLRRLIVKKLWT